MSNISELIYPKKSHRKIVLIPNHSRDLAEFYGIMMGDGGINNHWQANITVNSISDLSYSHYIAQLSLKLFGILPAIRKRKTRNALVISLASTSVVDFLVSNGLPRGNKLKHGLRMPEWILSEKSFQRACVRGLVDTDGCIYIHNHTIHGKFYRNIGLTFTSNSPELIFQVATILQSFQLNPHISKRGNNIFLYGENEVRKYLKVIGTSNHRIKSIFDKWRGGRAV